MIEILEGDALERLRELPAESVQCCVTSPPYWGLRDYGTGAWEGGDASCDHVAPAGVSGGQRADRTFTLGEIYKTECGKCGAKRVDSQLGLERTPEEYVARMVEVFREVRRVLRKDGTLWLNLGSSYAGAGYSNNENTGGATREQGGKQKHTYVSSDRRDVPSCDSGGKEQLDYRGAGRVCPDCGDELTACSQNHSRRNSHNGRLRAQSALRPSQKDHDTALADYLRAYPSASPLEALVSNTPSLQPNVLGVSGHEDRALELPLEPSTSSGDVQQSEDNSVCTSDTVPNDRPSDFRMLGNAYVCMACGYSTRMFPPHKSKDLVNIPFMVAEALRADGWWLRSDIIWAKPNPMPESVTDRPTKSHEYLFLLTKSASYYYDSEAIREPIKDSCDGTIRARARTAQDPLGGNNQHFIRETTFDRICGANKRSVWTVTTLPYPEAHFATYPPDLIKPCILAGSRVGDTILDPFAGSGTTGAVALELGRKAVLIELNPKYVELIEQRCDVTMGLQLA